MFLPGLTVGILMHGAAYGGNCTVCHWLCQCFSSTQEDTGKASGTPIATSAAVHPLVAAEGCAAFFISLTDWNVSPKGKKKGKRRVRRGAECRREVRCEGGVRSRYSSFLGIARLLLAGLLLALPAEVGSCGAPKAANSGLIEALEELEGTKKSKNTDLRQERWTQVEQEAVIALKQLAEDHDARRILAGNRPGLIDEAVARGGPRAVLLLIRLEAHLERYALARQLAVGLLACCPDVATDPALEALTTSQLGAIEGSVGRLANAEQCFRRTVELCDKHLEAADASEYVAIAKLLARSHDELGVILYTMAKYSEAQSSFDEAIGLWRRLEEENRLSVDILEGQRRALCHLVGLKKAQGRYQEAIRDYHQLLSIEENSEAGGFDLSELYGPMAECYYLLARTGNDSLIDDARDWAKKALAVAEQRNEPRAIRLAKGRYAAVLFEKGQQCREREDVGPAADFWQAAREIWEQLLAEYIQVGDELSVGSTRQLLGDAAFVEGDSAKAVEQYQEAIRCLMRCEATPITQFNAYMGMARVCKREQDFTRAEEYVMEAIQAVEVAGAQATGSRRQQLRYHEQFCEAYDLLMQCMIERGDVEGALEGALCFVENLRNRLLQDELLCLGDANPLDALAAKEREAFLSLREYLKKLYHHRSSNPDDSQTILLPRKIAEYEWRILELWNTAREKTLARRGLLPPLEQSTTCSERLREIVRTHGNDVILYYHLGAHDSYLIVIDGQQPEPIESHRLTITPAQGKTLFQSPPEHETSMDCFLASALVEEFIGHLGAPKPVSRTKLQTFEEQQALVLSEILLPPQVLAKICRNRYEHVIIVPDPMIHRLPFVALPVKSKVSSLKARELGDAQLPRASAETESARVIDLFPPICYVPSLQVLHLLESREVRQRPGGSLIAFGGASSDLQKAREECQQFVDTFPDCAVRKLIGLRADKRLLELYDSSCRLALFADHAVNEVGTDGLTSHFRMALDQTLTLDAILELDLDACEAVILSACGTNLGTATRLDSGQSLARAFLIAGAARVVATNWAIPDDFSTMTLFFQNLAGQSRQGRPIDYARALHEAMKRASNEPGMKPYRWAAFALVGPPVAQHAWRPSGSPLTRTATTTNRQSK